MSTATMTIDSPSVLGIIAGEGRLPMLLIDACQKNRRPFFVLAFEGSTDPEMLSDVPHVFVRLGAIGEALDKLREVGASELVMAGKVTRPSLSTLRPDATGARLLTRLGAAFFLGDNALFKAIVSFLEEEGFSIIGSEDVLRDIIAPEGVLGKIQPDDAMMEDVRKGVAAAHALGEQDLGQAVIVHDGNVIGVEDSHGTDALIARCARNHQEKSRGGVLVKMKKPQQETRVDLPAIGPITVENVHAAGLCGIAIEAGGGIIIDKEKMIEKADALGIFVVGVKDNE